MGSFFIHAGILPPLPDFLYNQIGLLLSKEEMIPENQTALLDRLP